MESAIPNTALSSVNYIVSGDINCEKMTRDQINERLVKLRKSRLNDESYTITQPAMVMCYRMALPWLCSRNNILLNLRPPYEIHYNETEHKIEYFSKIVEQFRSTEMEAQFICNFPSCVKNRGIAPYEIHIKTADERK